MIYCVAILAVALCASLSNAQDMFTVPITVGKNQYQIRYNPATEPVNTVARRFCIDQADSLGYTPQNPLTDANINGCTAPVMQHLQNAAAAEKQKRLDAAGLLAVRSLHFPPN
jgi:hypothetical protein